MVGHVDSIEIVIYLETINMYILHFYKIEPNAVSPFRLLEAKLYVVREAVSRQVALPVYAPVARIYHAGYSRSCMHCDDLFHLSDLALALDIYFPCLAPSQPWGYRCMKTTNILALVYASPRQLGIPL